jgi:hypothetical protein
MNVGTGLVFRFSRRDGVIHDVPGLMDDVRRLRRVRFRRLFNHEGSRVQER